MPLLLREPWVEAAMAMQIRRLLQIAIALLMGRVL